MKKIFYLIFLTALVGCRTEPKTDLLTLSNGKLTAKFTVYGARLVSLSMPDKNGKATDVVWGFESTAAYRACKTDPYYGAIIGRYGNRIGGASFKLDGREYRLEQNDGPNSLHGGPVGFHDRDWTVTTQSDTSIVFSYVSAAGEGGYPGKLSVKVTYSLGTSGLKISYEATTDQPTVLNLTNHAFWNLNGTGDVLGHQLRILANRYTPVDRMMIPTGELASVKGTPFDFTAFHTIGERIGAVDEQLRNGKGYDHNYVLNQPGLACEVMGDRSGIRMRVLTDQPGLQFYSGNFMAGKNAMTEGKDNYRWGFCLETQHFPDSPNKPGFPSTVLRPGEVFQSVTEYRFD